jgi:hypothetical protein
VLFFILLVCANAAAWLYFLVTHASATRGMPMIRTTEPLYIGGIDGDGTRYVLPAGATLYADKHFAEGFTRYIVYFNHKGLIEHEEVEMKPEYGGNLIDPLWLENIDEATQTP